jgi:inosine-uridine nucleoside N-ribohydrolase
MDESIRIKNLTPPAEGFDCVIDTDAYNETDDQFAIAYLVKSGRANVRGIFAAPFFNENSTSPGDGMEKSHAEILNLISLMGKEDMNRLVFKGSDRYLPDEKTPVVSDAARELCRLAGEHSPENPLYVVSIGCITNIASAIIMDPAVAENTVIVWLGGHSPHWCDTAEFNMMQDVAAARVVFGCGAPLVQLPCAGVVSEFYSTRPELDFWLKGKNALCDYLVEHTVEAAESYAKGRVWSRVIWDVTAVGWLFNGGDRFMMSEFTPAPIPEYDNHYAFDPRRHTMRRVTHIHRDALMGDMFSILSK